jgi:hypothetical protein
MFLDKNAAIDETNDLRLSLKHDDQSQDEKMDIEKIVDDVLENVVVAR